VSGWTLPTVHPSLSQLTAACGDFEKKEGEEGGCLRRSEEKSNTHLSLHFSFKSDANRRPPHIVNFLPKLGQFGKSEASGLSAKKC